MVNLVIVRNPFNVEGRETTSPAYVEGKTISYYFCEEGKWVYSVNGEVADADTVVKDNDNIVIMPLIEGKWFRVLLTIGLSVATAGIFGAANGVFGGMNMFWRAFSAMAISMVGNAIINKIAPLKTDASNTTEQSTTYGWGGTQTVVGQGSPLAITYGSMKSGGMLLSRHIISDGEKQYLNMLYCAGEGELSSISDVRINDNPVANYSDVEVDIRLGTNDQEVIPNFNDNYSDQQLAYELSYVSGQTSEWCTQLVEGNSCQGLEITLSLPNGLYYSNDSGGMSTTSLRVEAQYRVAGGEWASLPLANDDEASNPLRRFYTFVNVVAPWFNTFLKDISGNKLSINPDDHTGKIKAATNEAAYRVYRFDNLPAAQYEVRVRCSNKDGTTIRHVNKIYWSQLTQIVYDDFIHPGKVLVGIKALATDQLSGSEPQITWLQTRQNVYVYNPYTLAYEIKPADNPAWACYDILHHARLIGSSYVIKGVPAGQLDYDSFNAWASKCTAKNYKFNFIYDSAGRIWDALQYPEAVGHGHVIIKGTRFSCVYDFASNPMQLFTVANIKKDSFREDFQGTQGRANCVEISFMNAAKNYERDVIPVYSDDYDSTDSLNEPTQIELMGCTSLGQAYAHGRQYLRNNKYEMRTVTFEAYVDAIACTLADVVLVSHDVTEWGTSGRIKAINGLELTLDADVTMFAGQTYSILIRDSSTDTINTYSVTTVAGTTNVITLVSGTANVNDIFAFGMIGAEAKAFRILSIAKGHTEQTRKLTCMEYFDELYDDSGDTPPNITYVDNSLYDVTDLSVSQATYRQKDGGIRSDITVSWINPRRYSYIQVYYKQSDDKDYVLYTTLKLGEQTCTIGNVMSLVNYDIKIVAINDIGLKSTGVVKSVYVTGQDLPPSAVTNLVAVVDPSDRTKAVLKWDAVIAADLKGYRVTIDGNTYDVSATTLTVTSANASPVASVVAVDNSGNTSTAVTVTVPIVPKPSDVTGFAIATELTDRSVLNLTWDAVSDSDLAQYEIRMGTDWASGTMVERIKTNRLSYRCVASGYYKFWIAAVNSAGRYSNAPVSADKQVVREPDQPTNLAYTQDTRNAKNVILSWTATSGLDIYGYEITRNDVVIGIARGANYTDVINASDTYVYKIRTRTVGEFYSGYATLTAAITLEPLDVTGFSASQMIADRSIVRLTWTANSAGDLSHYEIREGSSWDEGAVVASHAVGTYVDITISEERTYTWWIKAVSSNNIHGLYPASVQGIFNLNPTPVSNIQMMQNTNDKSILNIQWSGVADGDLIGYKVKIGSVWESAEDLPMTQELYTTYNLTSTGNIKVIIKTINSAGYYSDEVSASLYCKVEPLDVTGLVAYQNGETVELYWDKATEADVTAYEIREGANFDQGSLISTGVTQASYMVPVDSERDYKFFVKAINSSGHYSVVAANITINVQNLPVKNVIETYDEITLNNGTHSNTEFGQSLINFSNIGGKWSDFPTTQFSDVGGSTVLKLLATNGIYPTSGIYSPAQIDVGSIISANISARFVSTVILRGSGSAVLQFRTSQDGSNWLAWQDFKPVKRTFRYLELRVLLGTTDTSKTPEVNQFVVSIDVPDTDIAMAATIAVGGTTVNYGHTFYTVPYVTPIAVGEGLHADLISKTKTNCVIKIKNASNVDVGGTADVRIKGY